MFNDTDQHVLFLQSLGVWFVSITTALEKACKHMTKASGIMSILSRVFEQAQPQQRWLKGVTSVVLANTMVI